VDSPSAWADREDGDFRFEPESVEIETDTTMPTLVEAMKRRNERAHSA